MSKIEDAALKLKTILDILDHRKTQDEHKEIMKRKTDQGKYLTEKLRDVLTASQTHNDKFIFNQTITAFNHNLEEFEDIINENGSINFNLFSEDDLMKVSSNLDESVKSEGKYESAKSKTGVSVLYSYKKENYEHRFTYIKFGNKIKKFHENNFITELKPKTFQTIPKNANAGRGYVIYKLNIDKIKTEVNAAIEAAKEVERKKAEEAAKEVERKKAEEAERKEKEEADAKAAEEAAERKKEEEKERKKKEAEEKEMKEAILNKLALTQPEIEKFQKIIDEFEKIPSEQKTEAYNIIKPLVDDFNTYTNQVSDLQNKYNAHMKKPSREKEEISMDALEMKFDKSISNSSSPSDIRKKFNALLSTDDDFTKYLVPQKNGDNWVIMNRNLPLNFENSLSALRIRLNNKNLLNQIITHQAEALKKEQERKEKERLEAARKEKERKEKERLEAVRKEKEEADAKAKAEEELAKQVARLEKERKEKERLAAEEKRKKEEEEARLEAERKKAEEARLKAVFEEVAKKAIDKAGLNIAEAAEFEKLNKIFAGAEIVQNNSDKKDENLMFISFVHTGNDTDQKGGKPKKKKKKKRTQKVKKKSNKKKRKPKRKTMRKIKKIIFR